MRNKGIKKYSSVFMLCARLSIYKVLGFCVLMFAGLVAYHMNFQSRLYAPANAYAFHYLLDEGILRVLMSLAWVLALVLLCLSGCNMRKRSRHLLWRLQISKWKVWLIQCVYNAICLLIVWATQVAAVLSMYVGFVWLEKVDVSYQTLAIECYKSKVLRGLLPMEDVGVWIFRILVLGICAIGTAWIATGVWKGEES